jgi:hypothetical protein
MNPNPRAGMDAKGVITFASTAPQKIYKKLGFFENPSLFVPDNKEEILLLHKESTDSKISREITLNTACFSENIARIRELQDVSFRNIFFNQADKEEIKRLPGKDRAIGTSNREGD